MGAKSKFPWIYPQTLYKLTKISREEKKAQELLSNFVIEVIAKRKNIVKQSDASLKNIPADLIISNEDKFTFIEIRDHIQTILSAYETTAISLSHTILLLAMNPNVQEKLFNELTEQCVDDFDIMSTEVLRKCEYLDMVFDESCRLMPAVPIILRETLKDFEIEKDVMIPEGVCLAINFFALHRNKLYWGDDADKFEPERFSKENSENRRSNTFFPFSAGQRICIGSKYSDICMKILIARLVKKYKFKTSLTIGDLKLKSFISLKLCGPHSVAIEKRN